MKKRTLVAALFSAFTFVVLSGVVIWAQDSNGARAIVDMKSGYLLGGSARARWLQDKAIGKSLRGGEVYRIYSATRYLGQGRGSKPKSEGAPCETTLFSKVEPNKGAQSEFAITGKWNALPRVPRIESNNQAVYRNAVARVLKSRGIKRPKVKITQVWRVDLEGDGTQEVLISATDKAEYPGQPESIQSGARAGQYSLVMLRKIVRGKVQTQILAGEFYPKAKTFNAPGYYRIAATLDADGDGKMEVLLRSRYYEGDATSVYAARGSQFAPVAGAGCGA